MTPALLDPQQLLLCTTLFDPHIISLASIHAHWPDLLYSIGVKRLSDSFLRMLLIMLLHHPMKHLADQESDDPLSLKSTTGGICLTTVLL